MLLLLLPLWLLHCLLLPGLCLRPPGGLRRLCGLLWRLLWRRLRAAVRKRRSRGRGSG